jgi:hypothetical protein
MGMQMRRRMSDVGGDHRRPDVGGRR